MSVDSLGDNENPIKLIHYKKVIIPSIPSRRQIVFVFPFEGRVMKVLLRIKEIQIEEEP